LERLLLKTNPPEQNIVNEIYAGLSRRANYGERSICPAELTAVYARMCQSQSCGKCTPCRTGLNVINALFTKILDGTGKPEDLELIGKTAKTILDSADCAIGFEAAELILKGMDAYRKDFESHINRGTCVMPGQSVSCRRNCPADVDIPGYIALCRAGRYEDALRLIRKDNPLPAACALVCEHPCEHYCRRGIMDDAVNIRAIKRVIIEKAKNVSAEPNAPSTGKKTAVIGGGPAGLSAAYYLARMGHDVTVYEKRERLGGMLRYGIPVYRLPDKYLDYDINAILATGVKTAMGKNIGTDITLDELRSQFDAVLITIGAHKGKALGIPGEESRGVLSAVKLLSDMGDGNLPDFTGKNIVVIGGGNVAMDATRTGVRLGAESVRCVYRRRIADMTALPEEVEGAIAEGAEILPLLAPVRIESDGEGNVTAVIFQSQIIGGYRGDRPAPRNAKLPEERIPCDVVVMAIGQDIESEYFAGCGITLKWDQIKTQLTCAVPGMTGVFAGGDCSHGPSTVIRAIEAGKVSAANIDAYLGFKHIIETDISIPPAPHGKQQLCGRVTNTEREALERKKDFDLIERNITDEEAAQECSRCLRCDQKGLGALKDGRVVSW
jgi:NADPH-dependent glutamate synthase beta subunit-like oxidoreductase